MNKDQSTGFLLVDKPQGWTSHDVVAKVRGMVKGKVGHAGTLDPMATGLLVIGLGRATKLLRFVQGREKEYLATAQLGVATDSLDADGAVLSREPLPVTAEQVDAAMERLGVRGRLAEQRGEGSDAGVFARLWAGIVGGGSAAAVVVARRI